MTTEQSCASAPSTFDHLLDQLTLAFEPYQTVAELLGALDRAADCKPLDVPQKPLVPLWEEPLWSDLTYQAEVDAVAAAGWPMLADAEPQAGFLHGRGAPYVVGGSPTMQEPVDSTEPQAASLACHYTQKSDI